MKTRKKPLLFLFELLIIAACMLMFYPVIMMVLVSLKDEALLASEPLSLKTSFAFENYITAAKGMKYWRALLNSSVLTVFSSLITTFFGACGAYAIMRARRGKKLFLALNALFLIGLAILTSITGYLLMPSMAEAVARLAETGEYRVPLTVCAGLMVTGLGIKSAMFPFHLWLPDAHGGATTASSALLSGLVLKGYIVLMMTLMVRVFSMELMVELGVTNVVLLFGLLGMIFGSLGAMREYHVKRMLAYSSVAQIGYIFMGIGLGSAAGLVASCFHILVHACCKPLLFCCAGRLSAVSGHHRSLKNLRGSAYRDIAAGVGFTVGSLSMIGIPLFGGFVSKLYFASASLPTNRTAVTLLTIALSTVLNALYYIPALLSIWMRPDPADERAVLADATPEMLAFDRPFTAAAAVFTASIFILGIFYHPITDIIEAGIRLI